VEELVDKRKLTAIIQRRKIEKMLTCKLWTGKGLDGTPGKREVD